MLLYSNVSLLYTGREFQLHWQVCLVVTGAVLGSHTMKSLRDSGSIMPDECEPVAQSQLHKVAAVATYGFITLKQPSITGRPGEEVQFDIIATLNVSIETIHSVACELGWK